MNTTFILITVNIVSVIVLLIIFVLAVKRYANEVFFDISIIFNYIVFTFPLVLLIINFITLLLLNKFNPVWSLIFLLIPLINKVYVFIRNFNGEKRYKQFSKSLDNVYKLISKNNLDVSKEDLNIRVRNRKNVNIVINVYSLEDEKRVKELRSSIIKSFLQERDESKYKIRLLIDKKKDEELFNSSSCEFS